MENTGPVKGSMDRGEVRHGGAATGGGLEILAALRRMAAPIIITGKHADVALVFAVTAPEFGRRGSKRHASWRCTPRSCEAGIAPA